MSGKNLSLGAFSLASPGTMSKCICNVKPLKVSSRGMEFSEAIETEHQSTKRRRHYIVVVGSIFVALALLVIIVTVVVAKNHESRGDAAAADYASRQLDPNRYTPMNAIDEDDAPDVRADWRGKLVMLVDGTELVSFDHKSKSLSLLYRAPVNGTIVTSFDADLGKTQRHVYRAGRTTGDDDETTYVIEATSLIADDVDVVVQRVRFEPSNLALDRATGNLYVIDEDNADVIAMSRRDGYYVYAVILKDLLEPRGLALDPEDGLVFVLQRSRSILRANTDGTEAEVIVAAAEIGAIAIDASRKRAYWVENRSTIQSAEYDGTTRRRAFFRDVMAIETLAILDDRLFWTWTSFGNATNLFHCRIEGHECGKHSSCNVAGNVTFARGYSSSDATLANPCELNNCGNLCLSRGRNESICLAESDTDVMWTFEPRSL